MDFERIKCTACDNGWELAEIQPDNHYLRFVKGEKMLDIWKTGTVRFIPMPYAKAEHYRNNTIVDIEELLERLPLQ